MDISRHAFFLFKPDTWTWDTILWTSYSTRLFILMAYDI